jgi:hypothetical protein
MWGSSALQEAGPRRHDHRIDPERQLGRHGHDPSTTAYTLHPQTYTLHPTPYTLHPQTYTLHPTPYTLHITSYTRRHGHDPGTTLSTLHLAAPGQPAPSPPCPLASPRPK